MRCARTGSGFGEAPAFPAKAPLVMPAGDSSANCEFITILHLEDNSNDAELIREALRKEGIVCQLSQVWTREDFLAALGRGGFDLILADNSLPAFDGGAALGLAKEHCPDVPFIFLSGTMNGFVAAEGLR